MSPLNWLFTHTSLTPSGVFLFDTIVSVLVVLYTVQYLWKAGGRRGRGRRR